MPKTAFDKFIDFATETGQKGFDRRKARKEKRELPGRLVKSEKDIMDSLHETWVVDQARKERKNPSHVRVPFKEWFKKNRPGTRPIA